MKNELEFLVDRFVREMHENLATGSIAGDKIIVEFYDKKEVHDKKEFLETIKEHVKNGWFNV